MPDDDGGNAGGTGQDTDPNASDDSRGGQGSEDNNFDDSSGQGMGGGFDQEPAGEDKSADNGLGTDQEGTKSDATLSSSGPDVIAQSQQSGPGEMSATNSGVSLTEAPQQSTSPALENTPPVSELGVQSTDVTIQNAAIDLLQNPNDPSSAANLLSATSASSNSKIEVNTSEQSGSSASEVIVRDFQTGQVTSYAVANTNGTQQEVIQHFDTNTGIGSVTDLHTGQSQTFDRSIHGGDLAQRSIGGYEAPSLMPSQAQLDFRGDTSSSQQYGVGSNTRSEPFSRDDNPYSRGAPPEIPTYYGEREPISRNDEIPQARPEKSNNDAIDGPIEFSPNINLPWASGALTRDPRAIAQSRPTPEAPIPSLPVSVPMADSNPNSYENLGKGIKSSAMAIKALQVISAELAKQSAAELGLSVAAEAAVEVSMVATAVTTFATVGAAFALAGGIALTVVGTIEVLTVSGKSRADLLARHEAIKQAGELTGPLGLTGGLVGVIISGEKGLKDYSSYGSKIEDALEFREILENYGEVLPPEFLGGSDNSSESISDRMKAFRNSADTANRCE